MSRISRYIDTQILPLAISQASKAQMTYAHGAVVWKSGTILGAGYNVPAAPPTDTHRRFSIHAERAALTGIRGDMLRGACIFVTRLGNNGSIKYSAPCAGCRKLLRRKGLRKIYFFDRDGSLTALELQL